MTSPLERVGQGDGAAVNDCVAAYGPAVFGLARRLLADEHEAEDVVQEIFMELWQSAHRYDARRAQPLTFVMTLARRRIIDRLRRAERRPVLVDAALAPVPAAPDVAETDAELATVRRALGELPEGQQTVLMLAIYGGFSHADIAERLALPLGTVKSHARRGMATVAAALRAEATT